MPFVSIRYLTLMLAAAVFVLSLFFYDHYWLPLLAGALTLLGISDLLQTKHALRRNYPILAHFRYTFESVRPEIRQYFLESDSEATPFSRNQRSIVYQRAKQETDKRPFGTQLDMYQAGYEWINHSIAPVPATDPQRQLLRSTSTVPSNGRH